MKYVRKRTLHTIIALTLAYLFTSPTVAVDSQSLSIDLRVENSKIVVGFSVIMNIEVHSNDSHGVWIPWFIDPGGNLEVLIMNQKGERVRHRVPHKSYSRLAASSYARLIGGHYLGRSLSLDGRNAQKLTHPTLKN